MCVCVCVCVWEDNVYMFDGNNAQGNELSKGQELIILVLIIITFNLFVLDLLSHVIPPPP